MSHSSWLWKVLLSDWHEVSEWPCLQASGLKLVWDSSFLPSFFLGRLSSLTRNFYNLCSDCPLWILNNNSMCPDPIYCRVEYDPKGQAGRLLQTPFCMAIFSVMFQTRGVGAGSHSWGVQEKWKQCGRPCVTEPRSERKCCSVTCVDGAVGFQSVSTRWHQVTEACKTFCLYPDCGGHCMVLIRVVEVSEVCLGFNFVSLFSDSTKSFESWSSLFLFLDLMQWKVFLCSSIRWLQRGK